MTDESTEDIPAAPPLTNEQRLRALTSDRKRKSGAKGTAGKGTPAAPAGPLEADIVDPVRERSKDQGRDTPY